LEDQQGGRFRQCLFLAVQLSLQLLDLLAVFLRLLALGLGLGGAVGIGLQAGFAPGFNLLGVQALLAAVLGQFGLIQRGGVNGHLF